MRRLRELLQRRFVRNVGVSYIGENFQFGLGVVTSVVLTVFLFDKGMLGKYALVTRFFAAFNLLTLLAVGSATRNRLSEAMGAGDREEAKGVLTVFLLLVVVVGALSMTLGLIFGPLLSERFYGDRQIGQLARLLFLSIPLFVAFSLTTNAMQSARDFKRNTLLECLQGAARTVFILGIVLGVRWLASEAWDRYAVGGAVAGELMGWVVGGCTALVIYHRGRQRHPLLPTISELFANLFRAPLRKHFWFMFLISLEKGIANYYNILPIMVAGAVLPKEELAYFIVALTLVKLPKIASSAIAKVLDVKLPHTKGAEGLTKMRKDFVKASLWGGVVSLVSVAAFLLLLPVLIVIYRYSKGAYDPWKLTSVVLMTCIWVSIMGFTLGISTLYRVLNRLVTPMIYNCINLPLTALLGYYVLIPRFGVAGCGLYYSIEYIASQAIGFALAWRYLKQAEAKEKLARSGEA